MAPKPGMKLTYGKLGIHREFHLKEGNVVMATINGIGGKKTGPVLTNELRKGNWVKIVRGATATADDYLTVEKATFAEVFKATPGATDPRVVIGRIITDPTWNGKEPTTDLNYGEYIPRSASIDLIGSFMEDVFLKTGNQAIRPGDSVDVVDAKYNEAKEYDDLYVDKATNYNGNIVIYGAPANAPPTQTIRILYPTVKVGGA